MSRSPSSASARVSSECSPWPMPYDVSATVANVRHTPKSVLMKSRRSCSISSRRVVHRSKGLAGVFKTVLVQSIGGADPSPHSAGASPSYPYPVSRRPLRKRAELKFVGVATSLPEFADSGSVRSRFRQFDGVVLPANRRDLLRPSKDARTTPLKHCRLRHERSGLPGCTAPRLQFPRSEEHTSEL